MNHILFGALVTFIFWAGYVLGYIVGKIGKEEQEE